MTRALHAAPTDHRRPHAPRRLRRHGVRLEPPARRALERAGWRTTLEFREDHVRGRGGRLVEVRVSWVAEAERGTGAAPSVVQAVAADPIDAWEQLVELAGQLGTK